MKLKFKVQEYQTNAVNSIIDCFTGQPNTSNLTYRIDPGKIKSDGVEHEDKLEYTGFKNGDLQITDQQILENIHNVQRLQNLPLSDTLKSSAGCKINLDVEMETGTGKTYCYIKTIFEMNKLYGWSKFIIVVPSIAIREGVYKSLEITAGHFSTTYGKKIRFFIYNSKQLHHLESFSSDAGINVMVINIQAFNARGADAKRIYGTTKINSKGKTEMVGLDDFQSRKPIDVISSNRPILILDEPQKMEGDATLKSLAFFKPLMIWRYSATHRTVYNKIHRLDALDAYNQKLVKKIAVRGISVKGLAGTKTYLYLESIEISKKAPLARIELEVKQGNGIKRIVKKLAKGSDLYVASGNLDQYRGIVISDIDFNKDTVEFTQPIADGENGNILVAGEAVGDLNEMSLRRIQIRETIKAHLDKEKQLYSQNIKVLSLFFIDEVAKYRDYSQPDENGEYARIFEEEYQLLVSEYMNELDLDNHKYKKYLKEINTRQTHNGYFSIDKNKKLVNPSAKLVKDEEIGEKSLISDDIDAYDLILKDKESLLSFPSQNDNEEDRRKKSVRFIFSHSALREGWDNPNVFVMCMLKHSDNTISRRQEVGRGLRLSVNQSGDRQDHPATVHDVNILTVVASESYSNFVDNLQKEISKSLSARPRKADEAYFTDKIIKAETDIVKITPTMAKQIYRYLVKNDYTDINDQITQEYHTAKKAGTLPPLPPELLPYTEQVFVLIDSVFSEAALPDFGDDRKPKKNPLNDNFDKKEFKELWNRINHKAVYKVEFEESELVRNCLRVLDKDLKIAPLQYTIQTGTQQDQITDDQLNSGESFKLNTTTVESNQISVNSQVKYDLIGKLAGNTKLTRKVIADILTGIQKVAFDQFKQNPEHFISEASRLINEQKACVVIEKLSYDTIEEKFDNSIFTAGQSKQDFTNAKSKLEKHIYDYLITDSNIERKFAAEMDTCTDIVVYAKLPNGFYIPTPVGDYNPDWAISFKEGSVKHIYFVAETKGDISSMELRGIEDSKIQCARKFFDEINQKINPENVRYGVADSFGKLMELVVGRE